MKRRALLPPFAAFLGLAAAMPTMPQPCTTLSHTDVCLSCSWDESIGDHEFDYRPWAYGGPRAAYIDWSTGIVYTRGIDRVTGCASSAVTIDDRLRATEKVGVGVPGNGPEWGYGNTNNYSLYYHYNLYRGGPLTTQADLSAPPEYPGRVALLRISSPWAVNSARPVEGMRGKGPITATLNASDPHPLIAYMDAIDRTGSYREDDPVGVPADHGVVGFRIPGATGGGGARWFPETAPGLPEVVMPVGLPGSQKLMRTRFALIDGLQKDQVVADHSGSEIITSVTVARHSQCDVPSAKAYALFENVEYGGTDRYVNVYLCMRYGDPCTGPWPIDPPTPFPGTPDTFVVDEEAIQFEDRAHLTMVVTKRNAGNPLYSCGDPVRSHIVVARLDFGGQLGCRGTPNISYHPTNTRGLASRGDPELLAIDDELYVYYRQASCLSTSRERRDHLYELRRVWAGW